MASRSSELVWPDPVPCRPENPVQGIRRCVARETGKLCPWVGVKYCGLRVDDMVDALAMLGLDDEFGWLLEDDVEADELAEAAETLAAAIDGYRPTSRKTEQAIGSVRWFARLLRAAKRHGCGLSGRFAERLDLADRY